jgi:hypothetical protein
MDFGPVLEEPFFAVDWLFAIEFVNCLLVLGSGRLFTNPSILYGSVLPL